jgi:NADPH2:quinone reductase
VLLEVHAVSVNFVDLVMMGGSYQFKPALPFVPGKLPVGVVAAVGDGVKNFKPGDRALMMAESGGFAEFVVMPEAQCVKIPESLAFSDAAAMALVYDTAYFALKERGRIQPGESVLVLGATGGVGLAAIQLAKAFGGKVLAAVASKDKADIVREAGADAIVDLSVPDLHDNLRQQVYALTDKHGADIIVDMLGGDFFDAAVRALAWSGRLIVIGFASGRIPSLKMNYVLVRNIEVSGMQISDYRRRRPAAMQACFAEIYALHAAGKLKALPTTVYPLERFAEALRDIKDRKVRGRIVLTMK